MTLNRGFTNEGDRIIDYLVRIYASILHSTCAYIHVFPGEWYIWGCGEAIPPEGHIRHLLGEFTHTRTSSRLTYSLGQQRSQQVCQISLKSSRSLTSYYRSIVEAYTFNFHVSFQYFTCTGYWIDLIVPQAPRKRNRYTDHDPWRSDVEDVSCAPRPCFWSP